MGYTQGLNFTAAVLSCTMGRDEAFWCLTALAESLAAHFVSGTMLQGAVADCECGWPVSIPNLLFVQSCLKDFKGLIQGSWTAAKHL